MTSPSLRRFPKLVETVSEESALESGVEAAPPAAEPSPYLAGEVVGDRYRLVREIGRGGMGVVWVAHSLVLGVDVALKLIRASAAGSALSSRMAREAHAAARLGHPALVRVFDFGWTRHGDPYLVMELVVGETLAALIKREARLAAIRAVQTLLPIADGLRVAHDKGIVHRDIKPDNVFLAADALGRRQPKLLDFGIAKVDKQVEGRLTQMGAVLGSPDYMSPEQALGLEDIDERTDIWSFCVVLYEVITGKVPFQKANYNALMHAIINEDPAPTVEFGAGDRSLWHIVERGLKKQREGRFQSMTELGEALALWLYEHGIKEDLSGNSIRAVWLDQVLLGDGGREQHSPRQHSESVRAFGLPSRAPTIPAGAEAESRSVTTLTRPRSARPALRLWLAIAGGALLATILAIVLLGSRGSSADARKSPEKAAPSPSPVQPVSAPPLAAVQALPSESVSATPKLTPSKVSGAKPRKAPVVRKKGHDFGF